MGQYAPIMRRLWRMSAKKGGTDHSLPEDMMIDDLLTADELAERLRVRPSTVRRWYRDGRIPAVRLTPKVIRFDYVSVVEALQGEEVDHA